MRRQHDEESPALPQPFKRRWASMVTVRTLLRFSPPIGVDVAVLGRTLDVPVLDAAATIELPGYDWSTDRVVSVPPATAMTGVQHFHAELFESDDDRMSWGESWRYNKQTGEATMHIGLMMASVDLDESLIGRSDYLYGVGEPQGGAIRQLRLDLDAWRSRFVDWVSLIAGQPVSPMTSPVPNGLLPEAPGTVVWVESGGEVVGLPSLQSYNVTVLIDRDDSEVLGFVLDEALFDRVVGLAATSVESSIQLRLLRSARVAIRRQDYRLALMELGSAAEVCLWTLFDNTVRTSTPAERSSWTLGRLVREAFPNANTLQATWTRDLVEPRNDAVHRAHPCSRAVALTAFALVRQIVSDELPEPLPTV